MKLKIIFRWSGAELVDRQQMLVSNNNMIASTNELSTERQFATTEIIDVPKPKL